MPFSSLACISARKIERLPGGSHNSVLGKVRKKVEFNAIKTVPAENLSVVETDEM